MEEVKKVAVVDFNSKRKCDIEMLSSTDTQIIDDKLAMRIKIEKAKVNAQKEMDAFKEIIQTTIDELEKLALFKDATSILETLFMQDLLKNAVETIIKGQRPAGMHEATFKDLRARYFKQLIDQYDK